MAVEQHIAKGDKDVKEKDFLTAISSYSAAIKENPDAFQAYLKRSSAYTKLKNDDAAKKDISQAFTIAENRGKRQEKGICHFRLALLNYRAKEYKPALKNFEKAKEYGCNDPTFELWKNKLDYDIKKNPGLLNDDDDSDDELDLVNIAASNTADSEFGTASETKKSTPKIEEITSDTISEPTSEIKATSTNKAIDDQKTSTNMEVINQHAPLKVKIRDDWYQSSSEVIITIYAKNVKQETLSIEFGNKSVTVSFPSSPGSEYNYNLDPLYDEIDQEKSTYKIYGTKIEITLVKLNKIKWASLEGSEDSNSTNFIPISTNETDEIKNPALTYPSSSRKAVNWDKFNVNDDEEEEKTEHSFFENLYKDVDDDTKRAMMKSYVQSNGTVLTTNWADAKDKEFETSPPEGMQATNWNQKPQSN